MNIVLKLIDNNHQQVIHFERQDRQEYFSVSKDNIKDNTKAHEVDSFLFTRKIFSKLSIPIVHLELIFKLTKLYF